MNVKIKIIIIIISFCVGGVSGYFIIDALNREKEVNSVSDNQHTQTQQDNDEDKNLNQNESIGRIDYPLIDIYFEEEKQYKIVITEYMQDKVYKEYVDDGKFFQNNKEKISIITVPCGRGTTTKYTFSVYEEETRIKIIDCQEVRSGILDDKW